MRTHLKSGSKNCYKAVFDFHLCPQEWTTLMHSETNLLQRSALWCYVGGRADVYSVDFLQTQCSNRPPEAINHQSNHCYLSTNQTNVVFRPIHPNKPKSTHPTNISSQLPLTPLSIVHFSTLHLGVQVHSFISFSLTSTLSTFYSSFLCFCFPAKRCSFVILPSWQTLSTNIFSQPHFDPLAPAAI